MTQWKLAAISLVALLLIAPNAAADARSETRTYEAAALLLSISGFEDPVGATTDGTVDAGGVAFATLATDTSVTLTIDDSVKAVIDPVNRNRVAAIACQDLDADNICDVELPFCGTGTVTFGTDPLGFQGGLDLVIFIYAAEVNTGIVNIKICGGPPQRAHSGTVTADFL